MALDTPDAPEARPLHHISRIDIEPTDAQPRRHPTRGWQVRARRDGTRLSKFFADARHDGREGALSAALDYRDRLLAELPEGPTRPRRAWSNTGVVGLSVREDDQARRSVQINWVDAQGRRRSGSFSVDKWGLRRALWNGCLKLYRGRQAAGAPVEAPHEMFARAQEPFADLIAAEIAAERADAKRAAAEEAAAEREAAEHEAAERHGRQPGDGALSQGDGASVRARAEARLATEEDAIRKLEDVLFG